MERDVVMASIGTAREARRKDWGAKKAKDDNGGMPGSKDATHVLKIDPCEHEGLNAILADGLTELAIDTLESALDNLDFLVWWMISKAKGPNERPCE